MRVNLHVGNQRARTSSACLKPLFFSSIAVTSGDSCVPFATCLFALPASASRTASERVWCRELWLACPGLTSARARTLVRDGKLACGDGKVDSSRTRIHELSAPRILSSGCARPTTREDAEKRARSAAEQKLRRAATRLQAQGRCQAELLGKSATQAPPFFVKARWIRMFQGCSTGVVVMALLRSKVWKASDGNGA